MTGASGFIGSHLVDALIARGEPVVACVREGDDLRWLDGKPADVRLIDVTTGAGLQQAVANARYVYHVAGQTGQATEQAFREVNHHGAVRMARAALEGAPGLDRFVYVSSTIALGPSHPDHPHKEDDTLRPIDAYGRSKRDAEAGLRAIDGLPLVVVRPPSTYGPRDPTLLPLFQMAANGFLPIVGSGRQKISLIYVGDLVDGLMSVGQAPLTAGDTFHLIAYDLDWNEIGAALGHAVGALPHLVRVPGWLAFSVATAAEGWGRLTGTHTSITTRKIHELRCPAWTSSGQRARDVLGFRAQMSFDDGLALTAKWYRSVGWLQMGSRSVRWPRRGGRDRERGDGHDDAG